MQILGRSTYLAIAVAVLLVTLVAAGCAGTGLAAGGPGGTSTPPPQATEPIVTAAPAAPTEPAAAPTGPASTPMPAATTAVGAVPTPDFTAIESLIKDIKDELGADASAGTDEGSTP